MGHGTHYGEKMILLIGLCLEMCDSPPNGGDSVGETINCSRLLDWAGEPRMGSGSGGLHIACATEGRFSARPSEPSRERGGEARAVLVAHSPCQREVKSSNSSKNSSCSGTKGRTTRSQFKRPATPKGGVASDSGESDCSQMSSVSYMSTTSVTARARKRTRTTAAKAAVEILPESDKDALERLAKENDDLRSQVASLNEAVAGLKNQLHLLSQQGAAQKSQASSLSQPASLPPDIEAQLRRSIALEVGVMMDAKLAALEGRLLPEKSLRPALASDARRVVASESVQTEMIVEKAQKKKRKNKKNNAAKPLVTAVQTTKPKKPKYNQHRYPLRFQRTVNWEQQIPRIPPHGPASSAPVAQAKLLKKLPVKLPKVPASAAITVHVREEATVGLGKVLAEARRRISLSEFGITSDKCREKRAADGGIVLMISGEDAASKADHQCILIFSAESGDEQMKTG
ncbi:hypothetical protein SFRURICE_014166 [Spodoptera frugiperda]|nr:hypothetical protein SFRURICE_014166 [Spodoptera frugiperda]